MPVQSIECQLVRAQIGRYLSGETFTTDIMRQLEVHLLACDECKEALASRKAELLAKAMRSDVSGKGQATAEPVAKPTPDPVTQKAAVSLQAFKAAAEAVAATPKPAPAPKAAKAAKAPKQPKQATGKAGTANFTKPMVLTLALGGVLLAMSRMSGQTGFLPFGPKAEATVPVAKAPTLSNTHSVKPSTSAPATPSNPAPTRGAVTPSATIKPTSLTSSSSPAPKTPTHPTDVAKATEKEAPVKPVTTTPPQSAAPAMAKTEPAKAEANEPKPTPHVRSAKAPHPGRRVSPRVRHKSVRRRSTHRISHRHSGQIRVYDASGAPISQ